MSISSSINRRGIIWWSCFDAGSVHWSHWYRYQQSVVAGESHCRCRSVASGNHEWSHGVVSEVKRTFHVRITMAIHGWTRFLSKRQKKRKRAKSNEEKRKR